MTKEELQAMTQEELRSLVVETSKVIKRYIDENTFNVLFKMIKYKSLCLINYLFLGLFI